MKNQKNVQHLLELLKKWLSCKLRRFRMIFQIFWYCITLSVLEKLKNSIFEIPIIPQTLNINNYRNTRTKSINLHIIRKLIRYSLKNIVWRQCLLSPFLRHCCSKVGRYYDSHSGLQGAERLKKVTPTQRMSN